MNYLVLVDCEPDDFVLLRSLIAEQGTILVGKGHIQTKIKWVYNFLDENDAADRWDVIAGMETEDDGGGFPEAPSYTRPDITVPPFNKEGFIDLIRNSSVVISSKPVDELLSLPDDVTFPGTQLFATMSFNLRAAAKGDLDGAANRLIKMFPTKLAWIESFPSIGPNNAGHYSFQSPTLSRIQYGWNSILLARQKEKLESLDKGDARYARTKKCYDQIAEGVTTNCLLVDALIYPLLFFPEKFPMRRVRFIKHNKDGYPEFEPHDEGGLYQAYQVEGLRDFVDSLMLGMCIPKQ